MRVLIVEDDVSVGELCRMILEGEGYACGLARSVATARESIASRRIDLLLADIVLPDGGSGRDLGKEMESTGIPVIYMSGEYSALRELADAGTIHMRKPFRVEELLARVRDAFLPPGTATADA